MRPEIPEISLEIVALLKRLKTWSVSSDTKSRGLSTRADAHRHCGVENPDTLDRNDIKIAGHIGVYPDLPSLVDGVQVDRPCLHLDAIHNLQQQQTQM